MPNPALLYGGAKLATTLGSFFGNNNDAEIKRLEALKKERFLDVNGIMGGFNRQAIEATANRGKRVDKSLQLDAGQAQGGALTDLAGDVAGKRSELQLQDQIGTANRNAGYDQQIAGLEGSKPSVSGLLGDVAGIGLETYANMESAKQAEAKATQAQTDRENLIPRGNAPSNYVNDYARTGGGGVTSPDASFSFDGDAFQPKPQANLSGYGFQGDPTTQQPQQAPDFKTLGQELDYKTKLHKYNQLVSGKPDVSKAPNYAKDIAEDYEKANKPYTSSLASHLGGGQINTGEFTPVDPETGKGGQIIREDPTKENYKGAEPVDFGNFYKTRYEDAVNRSGYDGDSVRVATQNALGIESPPVVDPATQGTGLDDPNQYGGDLQDFLPADSNQTPLTQAGRFANQVGQDFGARTQPLSPQLEDMGMKTFEDWGALSREEKIEALALKGLIPTGQ